MPANEDPWPLHTAQLPLPQKRTDTKASPKDVWRVRPSWSTNCLLPWPQILLHTLEHTGDLTILNTRPLGHSGIDLVPPVPLLLEPQEKQILSHPREDLIQGLQTCTLPLAAGSHPRRGNYLGKGGRKKTREGRRTSPHSILQSPDKNRPGVQLVQVIVL